MKISDFLKEQRKARCLTQDQMAKLIGVNRTTYATYENEWKDKKGKLRVPGAKTIKRISKLTGCSISYINKMIKE